MSLRAALSGVPASIYQATTQGTKPAEDGEMLPLRVRLLND